MGVILTGVICWALTMGTLELVWGWDHTLAQMSWFFNPAPWSLSVTVALFFPASTRLQWSNLPG
jgi:hypothetical protein